METGNKKKAPKRTASKNAKKEPARANSRATKRVAATTDKKKLRDRGGVPEERSPSPRRRPSRARKPIITEEQRQAMVSERAYFKAERRGFVGGDPIQDWCEAEAEVDALILRDTEDN